MEQPHTSELGAVTGLWVSGAVGGSVSKDRTPGQVLHKVISLYIDPRVRVAEGSMAMQHCTGRC